MVNYKQDDYSKIRLLNQLTDELTLGVDNYSGCDGDDCNGDQGGCDSDASCGQDC